tara:strand:- start:52 stop:747 length:696 start_codon:yes stop_codon:yes gene_type:complete
MNALLLSSGFGTRLSSFVKNKPKCLVKVNKKTILDYWLNILDTKHIDKIVINTHYKHNKIFEFVNKHKLRNKIIISHEEKILGSIGAILNNRKILSKYSNFFVAHSDNLTSFNFLNFYKYHLKQKKLNTVMTFDTKNFKDSGIFEFKNKKLKYYQKSQTPVKGPANAAIYIFNKKILKNIFANRKKIYDISSDLIPIILYQLNFYHNNDFMIDIGNKSNLLKARRLFKNDT